MRLATFYSWLRPYVNYFLPSMKLIAKERQGARVRKTYGAAQTARLIEAAILDQQQEQDLLEYKNGLNPCHLWREFKAAIERLSRSSKVTSSREATKDA